MNFDRLLFFRAALPALVAAAALLSAAMPVAASAATPIVVSGVADSAGKQTVSFAALRTDKSAAAETFASVLRNDLSLSGWFIPTDRPEASVKLAGSVRAAAGGGAAWSVEALWRGSARKTWARAATAAEVRAAAHAVADSMVEEIAGKRPMAQSHILFVGKRAGATDIYECDADGANLRRITTDGKLCLSPNWNPRSDSFLYTSWISGAPAVYQVDLANRKRAVVSSFPGMNHGAVKSPRDGRAAVVLSLTGSVELYLLDVGSRRIADRLTRSRNASEASPAWSPDGRTLAYTSDSGGVPRVYAMDVATRVPRRLVWAPDIRESVSPEFSCTGKLTFCGRSAGRYRIYVTDPARDPRTTPPEAISPADGADYEDPSWAPDGRHVVCTRTSGYHRSLVVLDSLGDPPRELFRVAGEWYLPSWSDNAIRRN